MNFKNSVIWITGASSGIGEALTYALHERNARLIISSRRAEKLEEVKNKCAGNKDNIYVLPLDLADTESLTQKTEEALRVFGHIDYLFNNGGISQRSLAVETDIDVIRNIMEVNFFGTIALTKAVLPSMMEREKGHIVVTSSVMGKFGTRMRSTYAASKHALHGWFDSLRQEVAVQNIDVTLVCPGFIKTNVTVNALKGDGSKLGEMSKGQQNGMSPDACARKILAGIEKGKEEFYIGGKEVWAVWLKRLAPRLLNKVLRKSNVT
ncbi:MAG: SDR family oxidoreductase [Balneolaceae bacterium]|nr:SDR family oxidoreductase [Balneolaceae bacterium]